MIDNILKISHFNRTYLCMFFFALFLMQQAPDAKAQVNGRYLSSAGTNISLQLQIPSPAPSSLILVQHIPPNIPIRQTSPSARKINTSTGTVKWLIKGVSAGTKTFNMQLGTAVSPGKVRASLRYRNPKGGNMVELSITP